MEEKFDNSHAIVQLMSVPIVGDVEVRDAKTGDKYISIKVKCRGEYIPLQVWEDEGALFDRVLNMKLRRGKVINVSAEMALPQLSVFPQPIWKKLYNLVTNLSISDEELKDWIDCMCDMCPTVARPVFKVKMLDYAISFNDYSRDAEKKKELEKMKPKKVNKVLTVTGFGE